MAQLALQVDGATDVWDFQGFIAVGMEEVGRDLGLGPVVGDDAWLLGGDLEADLVVGIGYPMERARALGRYLEHGARFGYPNLIHPTALVERATVALGRGNTITAGCILTTDIRIGDFNLLNWQVTVGHDARIGSFNVVNPSVNISGGVTMGDRILVGVGAQILEQLTVGSNATIGAGAVVTRNVGPGTTVVGIPARPLDRQEV
jgi:sugar O-acyltransferase (sialic acid O-acetyltransferase NeuD family)